ncbi:acyl-CoA dehydrogenase [Methylocapsa sp. S129]|uniref:acyl-CoA dehydrogenase n=1 Tax=Methylocapsa sp. S129 TaxID=1641869 RepID=UPI00131E4B4B|nr:acyl-CoA dehydrogenase [Methylocapsa sp. S129]
MTYRSPVADILYSLTHVAGFNEAIAAGIFGEFDAETAASVIDEAGRFATDVIAPLNRIGDLQGARYENGHVTSPPGFRDAYRAWAAGGWAGVTGSPEYGGMGLPHTINAACAELWNGASMGFALCPLLSEGAIGALNAYASKELRDVYLGKLIAGEWTGTMNLTEPQAGSDLNAVKTRAERAPDGAYRIFGQKIFITYGEHDMADNIVHLVLARLPDAPAGTRGLSLFLVPKFLVKPDGSLGPRNDVRCASIEHKLGIHASPTCVMIYGDGEGAAGWLVGEENRGLAAMFVMMNSARLAVGMQGVAIADRALQQALAYARDRRQGRGPKGGAEMSPIIEHADVQRMLLTMKALTHAARGVCHLTAVAIDRSLHGGDEAERRQAGERAALLTPVAKAFSTDIGDEVASLGVQVHGGMGYIEETGAAQHMRDARIAAIYEGANGVQAIDLVQRKLPLSNGATVAREIAGMRAIAADVAAKGGADFGATAPRLVEAIDALDRATKFLSEAIGANMPDALAGATPYLKLFGLALGGACLAKAGLAAQSLAAAGDASQLGRVALARFFAEKIAPGAAGLESAIRSGAGALQQFESALAEAT